MPQAGRIPLFQLIWSDIRRYVVYEKPGSLAFWIVLGRVAHYHPAFWGVVWYRYGHWAYQTCRIPLLKNLHRVIYVLFLPWNRMWSGCDIEWKAEFGPGLILVHGHQVVGKIQAGSNLHLGDGVLIGQRHGIYPTFGDDVEVGARAIVIGDIHIGSHVKIGAGAVVVKDVPDGATAVGNPARILYSARADRAQATGFAKQGVSSS